MGYLVDSGLDVLKNLRANQDKVFGRRYALYIITLATEIDNEAIDWLIKYGRVIDSLVGHAVAFITFYNTATAPLTRGNSRGLRENELMKIRAYTPNIDFDLAEAEEKIIDLDVAAMQGRYSRRVFNITMTYESDNIARFLGLNLKELPCLVFIDDPNGKEYHVLPIEKTDDNLFVQLREIIGEFYSIKPYQPYFDLLLEWKKQLLAIKNAQYRITDLQNTIEKINRRIPDEKIQVAPLVRDQEQKNALAILNQWLTRVYAKTPTEIEMDTLEKLSNIELFNQCKTLLRLDTSITYHLNILQKEVIPDYEQSNLEKYYAKKLHHLLPENWLDNKQPSSFTKDDWQKTLTTVLSNHNNVTVGAKTWLKDIQNVIDEIDLTEIRSESTAGYRADLSSSERLLRLIPKSIDDIKRQLDKQERPKISPILNKIKWVERGRTAKSFVNTTARTISSNSESVLKAIELGLKSQGIT